MKNFLICYSFVKEVTEQQGSGFQTMYMRKTPSGINNALDSLSEINGFKKIIVTSLTELDSIRKTKSPLVTRRRFKQ
jgi:hypothetical protein